MRHNNTHMYRIKQQQQQKTPPSKQTNKKPTHMHTF